MAKSANQDAIVTLAKSISQIERIHHRRIAKKGKDFGVKKSQQTLILYLANSKKTPTQKDISEFMDVSPAAVAVTLKKLEEDGLVERKVDPKDSRANLVYLSDEGKQITNRSRKDIDRIEKTMFDGFEEDELAALQGYLDRILDNIDNY